MQSPVIIECDSRQGSRHKRFGSSLVIIPFSARANHKRHANTYLSKLNRIYYRNCADLRLPLQELFIRESKRESNERQLWNNVRVKSFGIHTVLPFLLNYIKNFKSQ